MILVLIIIVEIYQRLFWEQGGLMTVYGYCRVSTPHQNLERQKRNICQKYPEAILVSESWTGVQMDRPQWSHLMRKVAANDTIVFDSVSRMSRTASEGIKTYMCLMEKEVNLVFLREPHINTDTYKTAISQACLPTVYTGEKSTDALISSVFDAIEQYMKSLAERQIELAFEQSEKEVLDLHQRTREGIETARQHGKTIGRPAGSGRRFTTRKEEYCLPMIRKLSKSFDGGLTDTECIDYLAISRKTFYRYKKKLREGGEK